MEGSGPSAVVAYNRRGNQDGAGEGCGGGGDNAKETVASLKKSFDLQGQEECSQCFKTKD